jgi:hypothetical protein
MEIALPIGYAVVAAIVYFGVSNAQRRIGRRYRVQRSPPFHGTVIFLSAVVAAAAILALSLALFGRMPSVLGSSRAVPILLIQTGVVIAIAFAFRLTRRTREPGDEAPDTVGSDGGIARLALILLLTLPVVAVEELAYRGFIRLAFPRSPTVFTIVSAALFMISRSLTDGLRPAAIPNDREAARRSETLRQSGTVGARILRRTPTAVGAFFLGIALAFTYALSASLPAVLVLHLGVEVADRTVVGRADARGTESLRSMLFVVTASVALFLLTGWWFLLA